MVKDLSFWYRPIYLPFSLLRRDGLLMVSQLYCWNTLVTRLGARRCISTYWFLTFLILCSQLSCPGINAPCLWWLLKVPTFRIICWDLLWYLWSPNPLHVIFSNHTGARGLYIVCRWWFFWHSPIVRIDFKTHILNDEFCKLLPEQHWS